MKRITWLTIPILAIGLWAASSTWAADGQSGDVSGITGCQIATSTPATSQVLSATGSKTCAWAALPTQVPTPAVSASAYKRLGIASATAGQNVTSTTTPGTDLTGLTVTVTADGTHDIKIEGFEPVMSSNQTVQQAIFLVIQKAGVKVQEARFYGSTTNGLVDAQYVTFTDTAPTAGSIIYKLSLYSGGTQTVGTLNNSVASQVAYIEATQIGT